MRAWRVVGGGGGRVARLVGLVEVRDWEITLKMRRQWRGNGGGYDCQ